MDREFDVREIKFRAYILHSMKMSRVLELIVDTGTVITDGYKYALAHDDVKLMQYTGLKDKNGVEIYEGDVVRLKGLAKGAQTGEVIYSETACKFAVRIYRDGYRKNESHLVALRGSTVIGNIHMNPELLEKQHD